MFTIPLVLGWVGAYVAYLIPAYVEHRFAFNFAADLMWLSSLFVLGSDFWDKVRALFNDSPVIGGLKGQISRFQAESSVRLCVSV